MITSAQLEATFRADLQALLDRYGAELSAEDHWTGYAECGEDVRMTVDIPSIWTDNEQQREYASIDLGKYVCPTAKPEAKP